MLCVEWMLRTFEKVGLTWFHKGEAIDTTTLITACIFIYIEPARTCLVQTSPSGFKDHPPGMVVEDGGALDLVSGDFEDDSDYEGLREEAPPRECVENVTFD